MLTMTSYSFGDVVLVPFPFTDLTSSKKRPAIVVSSDRYNRVRLDLILIAITSQTNPVTNFGEVTIANWQAAGLLKPSVVKPVLTTIEQRLVIRKLGQLQEGDRQQVLNQLSGLLGESE